MDRFSEMLAFTRVMEQRGFTSAAETLGISRASVSKQVAALERRLGVSLLQRTTRQVSPTEEGTVYYRHALQILEETDRADRIARAVNANARGVEVLKVAASPEVAEHVLLRYLPTFLESAPVTSVAFLPEDPALSRTDWGLAVIEDPLETARAEGRPIGRSTDVLVASSQYLESAGTPDSAGALSAHRLLKARDRDGAVWPLIEQHGGTYSVTSDKLLHFADRRSVLAACRAGAGIALLPDYMVDRDLRRRKLQRVLPDVTGAVRAMKLCRPAENRDLRNAILFEEFMCSALSRQR
ncbi:LysR family transcriptional regulator [Salipiger thiooxidans]|uniref:LysR family transcriptional regulator n=1 Tax=Salipiger thiooxidans TaxID=282683 RepID=UPI001CD1F544|nr:LysR family transcriptional regulator [Salipiger thiooxidans]MCA0846976.1 LysR family transcriptional regulator [Salipiger thiooxidans]